jgi:tight adherence protein C
LLILLAGIALAAASMALLARAVAMPRVRTTQVLGQITAYGFEGRHASTTAARAVRSGVDGLASAVGAVAARRVSGLREADLRNKLMAAGLYRLAPRKFIGYRVLSGIFVPVAGATATLALGVPALFGVVVVVLTAAIGWTAPMTVVRSRTRRRLTEIDYELPELIDQLIVTVEAGLGFNSSLQVAATRITGPLGDELRLALQEQTMGLSMSEALKNMLQRSETPAMRSFVRSVLQGETLGVSIGDIMRNLALEMRKRRRAAAEERAQKAPTKLLFPLIFLIFPAMFVVLLGPALFHFIAAFGGGG